MRRRFADRADAGRALATELLRRAGPEGWQRPLVLGLPRGGVPVAAEVAAALGGDLDVLVVRKVGAPWHPELAMGAVAGGGARVVDQHLVHRLGVDDAELEARIARAEEEVARGEAQWRQGRPAPEMAGRTVVVVDDGLATGATMTAAVRVVRAAKPAKLVVAAPVGPPDVVAALSAEADEVVVVSIDPHMGAVSTAYDDFRQTTDAEVRAALAG